MIKIPFALMMLYALCTHGQIQLPFNCIFNHMAFPVKDLDRSLDFYKRVLHLEEITNRSGNQNIRWLSLGGEKELHLISGIIDPVQVNKGLHLAVSTRDVNILAKHLESMGIAYSDWAGIPNSVNVRADGVKQIYFQDPDGYWIEVNNGYVATMADARLKDHIWQLEKDYWVYVKNRDFGNYLQLWDENFMGYPSTNTIGTKSGITDWITDMYQKNNGRIFDYELTRLGENVFGDIVMVFYDATIRWKNSSGISLNEKTYKLTHTWRKTGDRWLIIGGMGGVK